MFTRLCLLPIVSATLFLGSPDASSVPEPVFHCAFKGHTGPVQAVAFSPNGKLLASVAADKTVRVWELSSGRNLFTLRDEKDERKVPYDWFFEHVAFSPDGKTAAAGLSELSRAVLWDATSGKQTATLEGGFGRLAFSPDGKTLVTSGYPLRFWDTAQGKEVDSLLKRPDKSCLCVAFSRDGSVIASASKEGVVLWSAVSRKQLAVLPQEDVLSVAFSPDDKLLATGGSRLGNRHITLWDIATRKKKSDLPWLSDDLRQAQINQVSCVAFSPNGRLLAVLGSCDTNVVQLWDVATERKVAQFSRGLERDVVAYSLAFSPDGRLLAVPGEKDTVAVYKLTSSGTAKEK